MLDTTVIVLLLFSAVSSTMADLHLEDHYPYIVHPLTLPEQQLAAGEDLSQEQSIDLGSLLEYDGDLVQFIDSGIRRSAPRWVKLIGRRSSPEVADTELVSPEIDELVSSSCTSDDNDATADRPGCREATTKLVRDTRAPRQMSSFVRIGRGSPDSIDHVTLETDRYDANRPNSYSDRNRKQQSQPDVVRRAPSSFIRLGKSVRPFDSPSDDEGDEKVEDPVEGLTSLQSGKHQSASSTIPSVRCNNDDDKSPLAASLTRMRCRLLKIASGLDDRRPEVALLQNHDGVINEVTQERVPTKRYSSFVRIGRATRDVGRVQRVKKDVSKDVRATKVTEVPNTGSESRLQTIDNYSQSDIVKTRLEVGVKNEASNNTMSDKGKIQK